MSRAAKPNSWAENVGRQLGAGSIPKIYQNEILKTRSRTVRLFGRKCRPEIIYTFLGYEIKAFGKRITCPDEVTVRYLKLFAELGMDQIEVPLDPTQTERSLASLERALGQLQQAAVERFPEDPARQNVALRALYAWTRGELKRAAPVSRPPQR